MNARCIRRSLRLHLHETGSVWDRYEVDTGKPCVYTIPGRSAHDWYSYPISNGFTCESDPVYYTVPGWYCTSTQLREPLLVWIRSKWNQTALIISLITVDIDNHFAHDSRYWESFRSWHSIMRIISLMTVDTETHFAHDSRYLPDNETLKRNQCFKLQLHDAIYRLRFYSNSLTHYLITSKFTKWRNINTKESGR